MASKIIDEARAVLRRRHYSIHTERTYCDWIKRYIVYFNMQSRAGLSEGARKVEDFLTYLARDRQVAASTQNQALNALGVRAFALRLDSMPDPFAALRLDSVPDPFA